VSLPPYEPPSLVRHQPGFMNKFSRLQGREPLTHLDGVSVEALIAAYGSPLFVFSERTLVDRITELRTAMSRRWPKVRIAWSYKTNYLDGICRVFHREGAWAEVVSGMEYEMARRRGVPGEHIHFNGPDKSRAELQRALREGAHVHLDHFDELALAEDIAKEDRTTYKVAIRLNLAARGVPAWSRFGFNLENGQARDAVVRLLQGGHLDLSGLHCHLGTFILEPSAYRDQAGKLAGFANDIRKEFGVTLDFIDVGGGQASHNTLKAQYLPGEQATPPFSRYAEALAEGLSKLDGGGPMPTLVLETGRALVDDAGSLITTVIANKRLPDGRRGVVLDAGVNTLFTAFWYRHDVLPTATWRGIPEPTVLYGPLCMNIDVVRDTLLFPAVEPGQHLVVRNVGAYNVTQWMQFITYRPAVVLIGRDGQHALLRRREVLEDVTGPEVTPPWL